MPKALVRGALAKPPVAIRAGVYALDEPTTYVAEYVGRSCDLARREQEWSRLGLRFRILHLTDDDTLRWILEQIEYDRLGGKHVLRNKIRPMAPDNPLMRIVEEMKEGL